MINKAKETLKYLATRYEMSKSNQTELNILFEELDHAEENERILSIIGKHLSIVEPINDVTLVFDIDLWDSGSQKEEFAAVKEWLEKSKKDRQDELH